MKEKLVQFYPGSSWIQIGGSIQYLFAGDSSHPESEEMHMELTRLYEHMSTTPEWEEDGVGYHDL